MENNNFILTVLIFAYNHEKFIEDCLLSVLNQKTQYKYKVRIFDDFSTDNTVKIIKKIIKNKSNIQLINSKTNFGNGILCMKNNFGFKMDTKYFMFLDGDDYFTSNNKIDKQITCLEKNPQYVGCGHFTKVVDENKREIDTIKLNTNILNIRKWLFGEPYYLHTASWVWRNLFGSVYHKKIIKYKAWGDTLFLFNQLNYGSAYVIKDFMSAYRIHKNGIWSKLTTEEKNLANKKIERKKYLLLRFKYYHLVLLTILIKIKALIKTYN